MIKQSLIIIATLVLVLAMTIQCDAVPYYGHATGYGVGPMMSYNGMMGRGGFYNGYGMGKYGMYGPYGKFGKYGMMMDGFY
ncbi:uncharacterized protein LOC142597709 [Dermatophagoides farinae]|uniref:uncharacterized protein LOC142597709 n=1 Tax=Dermatophagoides farinae TaxID=6954 RepID=UPI003F5FE808